MPNRSCRDRKLAPWAWLAILMLLVCLPRLTIDAYLPALPAMADALGATDAQMQLTLTLYMAGYAISMLVCGPLSDRFGRRPVLLGGTMLYLLATLVCSVATTAPVIIIARLFQALGGCSGTVVGRVMVRDHFDRALQAQMLSRISAGMALSPMIAPLAGSCLEALLGWRWIFAAFAATGVLALLFIATLLPETHAPSATSGTQQRPLRIYAHLLRDRYFLRYALSISFVYCTYFPFIAESSTLLQRSLHLSGSAYALVFGLTVTGYLAGSNLFRRISGRYGHERMIASAVGVNLMGATLLYVSTAFAPHSLVAMVAPMMLVMLSVGIAIPACQFAVLQPYGENAGTASGLFFFIQMATTALCGAILGRMSDGSVTPMAISTFVASILFLVVWVMLRTPVTLRVHTKNKAPFGNGAEKIK